MTVLVQKLYKLAFFTHPNFKRHDLAGVPEVAGASVSENLVQTVMRAVPDIHYEMGEDDRQ